MSPKDNQPEALNPEPGTSTATSCGHATKCDKMSQNLSLSQQKAIIHILSGLSDRQVAEQIGVARQTICRWRHQDPLFIAELENCRREVWGAQVDRLRSLVDPALDALEERVKRNHYPADYRLTAAVHILRAVGLYGATFIPPAAITIPAGEEPLTPEA